MKLALFGAVHVDKMFFDPGNQVFITRVFD
jgi:hypothetical protein